MIKVNSEVYTVNAKTNEVESWKCKGFLPQCGKMLVHLVRGREWCFLPENCVYESKVMALEIAKKG